MAKAILQHFEEMKKQMEEARERERQRERERETEILKNECPVLVPTVLTLGWYKCLPKGQKAEGVVTVVCVCVCVCVCVERERE